MFPLKVEWLDVMESFLRRIELTSGNSSTVSKLTILLASKSDTGIYSCRRSKNLIQRFHLSVLGIYLTCDHLDSILTLFFFSIVDPSIAILEKSSIFVKQDATINLTCSITALRYSSDQVKWYHNGRLIENRQTNWRIKNRTCKADDIDEEYCTIETLFSLIVKEANSTSSGNYSCATDVLGPATVYVEVLNCT